MTKKVMQKNGKDYSMKTNDKNGKKKQIFKFDPETEKVVGKIEIEHGVGPSGDGVTYTGDYYDNDNKNSQREMIEDFRSGINEIFDNVEVTSGLFLCIEKGGRPSLSLCDVDEDRALRYAYLAGKAVGANVLPHLLRIERPDLAVKVLKRFTGEFMDGMRSNIEEEDVEYFAQAVQEESRRTFKELKKRVEEEEKECQSSSKTINKVRKNGSKREKN